MKAIPLGVVALTLASSLTLAAQTSQSVDYRLSFADAVHHTMDVDATFYGVPQGPLTVQMSRSSPGRYAAFEFASNVFEEKFTDEQGKPLQVERSNPRTWVVSGHHGTVHVTYRLFGDRVDGTFAAVDLTHAHINFPATVMWAHGMEMRPVKVTFALPKEGGWTVATQLYPSADASSFTAPNMQYLMDSPAELSDFVMKTFEVRPITGSGKPATIRVVMHAAETQEQKEKYFAGVQKLVREEQAVFGELPQYEPGTYTFLADAFPWDNGDGMEHRNSTVMTGKRLSLETVSHEFFHNWNVERIRPEGLEPFNFADVNMSGEMFVAEGFTQYYGNLSMIRSGLDSVEEGVGNFADDLDYLLLTPGSKYRSAMDMSRLAPLVDGSSDDFPKNWGNTFVSYYSFGDVVAMGLDLELRSRTDSRVGLDDFMRAMWRAYGKPGGAAPGLVGHPYTIGDVLTQLAAVSGDPAFAADFVTRYMKGTERIDYAPLLLKAGLVWRKKVGPPTMGIVRMKKDGETLRVSAATQIGSPAYLAGLDLDDELVSFGGAALKEPADLTVALREHKAGDSVALVFRRRGQEVHADVVLVESPRHEIVPVEKTGGTLTESQKRFREAWLGSKAKS